MPEVNVSEIRRASVLSKPLPPLCVDLDGTLLQTDTLVESIVALAITPAIFLKLPQAFSAGRAYFKDRIAAELIPDVALLPYNKRLLAYLQEQKKIGRYLVLATAANRRIANAVAAHLDLFDEVLASDETVNLKGAAKAEALHRRFPEGFVYAGDSKADLDVWPRAQAAIVVGGSAKTHAAARKLVPIEFETGPLPIFKPALRAMRPHQWVKNCLVFVPILMAHAEWDIASWIGGIVAFVAFCAVASGIYLLNDLADLSADRQHPRKRFRPLASGALPLQHGLALSAVLLAGGLTLAGWFGIINIVLLYASMSIAYSIRLKEFPLVDVFMLAALYTIRLVTGGLATGHILTLWLFNVSAFLFLDLAILKRVGELLAVAKSPGQVMARRGYQPSDTLMLQMLGSGAGFASCAMLALFVQADTTTASYHSPYLLWGLVPLMLFWQCRLWLATTRGQMHDDPIVYAARDRVSWFVGACIVFLLLAAKTGFIL